MRTLTLLHWMEIELFDHISSRRQVFKVGTVSIQVERLGLPLLA